MLFGSAKLEAVSNTAITVVKPPWTRQCTALGISFSSLRAMCARIEAQLIWELRDQLQYNRLGKRKPPAQPNMVLVHFGDTPLRPTK